MVTPAVLHVALRVYAEIVVGVLLAALCFFILVDPLVIGTAISIAFLGLAVIAIVALALWPFRSRRFWSWTLLLLIMVVTEAMVEAHIGAPWVQPVAFCGNRCLANGGHHGPLELCAGSAIPITTNKIFGVVSAYVLLAVLFATLFSSLQQVQPMAFHAEPGERAGWASRLVRTDVFFIHGAHLNWVWGDHADDALGSEPDRSGASTRSNVRGIPDRAIGEHVSDPAGRPSALRPRGERGPSRTSE